MCINTPETITSSASNGAKQACPSQTSPESLPKAPALKRWKKIVQGSCSYPMDINLINSPVMNSSGWLCLPGVFAYKHHPSNDVLAQLCCGKGCCHGMWCQYCAFSILSLPLAGTFSWVNGLVAADEQNSFASQKLLQRDDLAEHKCTPSRSHWHWGLSGRRETGSFGHGTSCFRDKAQALYWLFICLFGLEHSWVFNYSTSSYQPNKLLETTETKPSTKAMVPQPWATEQQLM